MARDSRRDRIKNGSIEQFAFITRWHKCIQRGRRSAAFTRADWQSNANADNNSKPNSNANSYVESYAFANSDAIAHSYTIAHSHKFPNAFAKRHKFANSYAQSFADTGIPALGLGPQL